MSLHGKRTANHPVESSGGVAAGSETRCARLRTVRVHRQDAAASVAPMEAHAAAGAAAADEAAYRCAASAGGMARCPPYRAQQCEPEWRQAGLTCMAAGVMDVRGPRINGPGQQPVHLRI